MAWEPRFEPTLEDVEEVYESLSEWAQQFGPIENHRTSALANMVVSLYIAATDMEWRRTFAEAENSFNEGNPNDLAYRLAHWDEVRIRNRRRLETEESESIT